MSTADEVNLEHVSNHDDVECGQGMRRLRDERDLARSIAVSLEQENAHLTDQLRRALARITVLESRADDDRRPYTGDIDGVPA